MSIARPRNVPSAPGIYFFRDKRGKVLYLGKAANLKNRIKSYFSGQKDQRISKMLETAKSIDWQETGSEIEALILESQLIKRCRPPFNIMLRDDKQYFYVGFTNEQFPKILISHQTTTIYRNIEVKIWVGPFTDGTALRVTLKLLRKIFPYCVCKQKHNNYCLNYHIGNCLGFCCLKKEASAKEINSYKKNIEAIKEMLNGRKISLIKKLEKDMAAAAKKKDFEEAIELRARLEKVKSVFENSKIIRELELKNKESACGLDALKKALNLPAPPKRIEGYDISNIQGKFATGSMIVFTNGASDKKEYRKFKIRIAGGDTEMLREIITRRFNHSEWPYPNLILIDGGKGQLTAARSAIFNFQFSIFKKNQNCKLNIPIIALTKNEKHIGDHILSTTRKTAIKIKKLPPAVRNFILQIDTEAHRFAIEYYRKLHREAQN